MMRENVKVSINEALQNENIAKYQTGALFESPDGQSAVAIIKGQLAIAGQKTEGEWDWTTVINDNEIIVSDVFTGALYTNLCTIMSANGKLTIENSLITMQDENNIVRFECGYKNGKYVFCLYDATGEQNVYINSSGEAVFAGKITSHKSAELYGGLTLGSGADSCITFMGPVRAEGSISVVDHEMDIDANYVRIKGIDVKSEFDKLRQTISELKNK